MNKRVFTEIEKQIIDELYKEGASINKISKAVKCISSTLKKYLNDNNYSERLVDYKIHPNRKYFF